ncbi:hypothetical protein QQP08_008544 [Theobroma cacao]|nr:hypothetical protein QQP08_008544 [Theobroma cacao]
MILQRYTFTLSPAYVHSPFTILKLQPQHGIQVMLHSLQSGSFFLYFLRALLKAFYNYWWIPHRIQNILRSQGIKGPPYEFIHGNNKAIVESIREASSKPMALTHDIFPRVLPHIYSCINTYGET